MMTTKKKILIGGAVIAAAVVGFVIYKKTKGSKTSTLPASSGGGSTAPSSPYEGKLIKSANNADVFKVENGLKRYVSRDVWARQGYSAGDITTLSAGDMDKLVTGNPLYGLKGLSGTSVYSLS